MKLEGRNSEMRLWIRSSRRRMIQDGRDVVVDSSTVGTRTILLERTLPTTRCRVDDCNVEEGADESSHSDRRRVEGDERSNRRLSVGAEDGCWTEWDQKSPARNIETVRLDSHLPASSAPYAVPTSRRSNRCSRVSA